MTQKLTPEEKEIRRESRARFQKFNTYIKSFLCYIFLIACLCAGIRVTHLSSDTALISGFVGGIGYAMLMKLKI
jgi:hypothetical protein